MNFFEPDTRASSLKDEIRVKLMDWITHVSPEWEWKKRGASIFIYQTGHEYRYFEFIDFKPYQGKWHTFMIWWFGKGNPDVFLSEDLQLLRKEIEANTLFVSRYKNNKLMRDSKIRGLIDSYLNFKGIAPGKSIPHIHEEFDYTQALVTKYGYDKVRRVVDKTIKDEYWGKSFDSFGFFNKKVQGETLFEKIYKSITGE